jgi:predicted secreted protein
LRSAPPAAETAVSQAEPSAAYDQVSAEQKELNSIVSKIQELHFKRVLCDNEADFEKISEEIKLTTLAGSQPDAKSYLEAKVDNITRTTAEYKLRLLQALESIQYDEHDKNVKWLRKMVGKYSKTA